MKTSKGFIHLWLVPVILILAVAATYLLIQKITPENSEGLNDTEQGQQQGDWVDQQNSTPVQTNIAWKLIAGDSSDTCTLPTYNGQVTVRGWYQYETAYDPETKNWYLHLSPEDLKNLPEQSHIGKYMKANPQALNNPYQFRLELVGQDLENKLKNASAISPVEFQVKGFAEYCEGPAILSVSSGAELLKKLGR